MSVTMYTVGEWRACIAGGFPQSIVAPMSSHHAHSLPGNYSHSEWWMSHYAQNNLISYFPFSECQLFAWQPAAVKAFSRRKQVQIDLYPPENKLYQLPSVLAFVCSLCWGSTRHPSLRDVWTHPHCVCCEASRYFSHRSVGLSTV